MDFRQGETRKVRQDIRTKARHQSWDRWDRWDRCTGHNRVKQVTYLEIIQRNNHQIIVKISTKIMNNNKRVLDYRH